MSGCNLRCVWCDTPYASWSPEGERRTIDSLVDQARRSGTRHVVITGGEPMLFDAIVPLARALRDSELHITVETAGTIHRDVDCDLMSLSPKLANSTPHRDPRDPDAAWARRHESRRIDPGALAALWQGPWDRQCKFVVTGDADLPEIDRVIELLPGASPADILLMPEGVRAPSDLVKHAVARMCMDRGFRYCARLHIDLFGDRRGT